MSSRQHDTFTIHVVLFCTLVGLVLVLGVMCSSEPVQATPPVIVKRPPALPLLVGPRASAKGNEATLSNSPVVPESAPASVEGLPMDGEPAFTPNPLPYAPPSLAERAEVMRRVDLCHRVSRKRADLWAVLAIIRTETDLGIPAPLATAAACSESALGDPDAVGDGGAAVGNFQLWPWTVRHCWNGDDKRMDPAQSLRCLWRRVGEVLPKVARRCGKVGIPAQLIAWSWVVSGSRRSGGYHCAWRSKHVLEARL